MSVEHGQFIPTPKELQHLLVHQVLCIISNKLFLLVFTFILQEHRQKQYVAHQAQRDHLSAGGSDTVMIFLDFTQVQFHFMISLYLFSVLTLHR